MATTAQEDPAKVAENMVMVRGLAAPLERCELYISGSIRSENPREFWLAVKAAVEASAQ